MSVPRGAWASKEGQKLLAAVLDGKLTRAQAAARASDLWKTKVIEKHVKDAAYRQKNPDYRAAAVLGKSGMPASRLRVLRPKTSRDKLAQLTDVAAEIVAEAVKIRIQDLEAEVAQLQQDKERLEAELAGERARVGSVERAVVEKLREKGVLVEHSVPTD